MNYHERVQKHTLTMRQARVQIKPIRGRVGARVRASTVPGCNEDDGLNIQKLRVRNNCRTTFTVMTALSQGIEMSSLPQYGFGADVEFDTLVTSNRFLFRVHTPKQSSLFLDDTDPFFVAPKYDDRYTLSPDQLSDQRSRGPWEGSYEDVARHMDWTTRSSSSCISTSFSFIWSIWEALRRHHNGMKKDVEIAVIDATAVSDRSATAVQLLRKGSPSE